MGWDFTHGSDKKDIIDSLTKPWSNEKYQCNIIKHTCVGQTLWMIQERINLETKESTKFIGCYILKGEKNYGWGYKGMDEAMHPYYYSCPLNYLDAVPVACEEWREGVRAYHAKQKRKFALGATYKLINRTIPEITLVSLKPLRGVYAGRMYKVTKPILGEEVAKELISV